jgi:hypothetical protein
MQSFETYSMSPETSDTAWNEISDGVAVLTSREFKILLSLVMIELL